jgi:enamine deaminase RidA (YjgF/YER057c/UK114 family)
MARRSITPPELSAYQTGWHMSPGIESNGLLFLTGMTGHRPNGASPDPETQIRDAFAKVESVLNEAGLDTSHIVEMTSYHVGIHDHIDTFRRVRDDFIAEPYPAWTAIAVTGLISEGTIVEIRIVADAAGGNS